MDKKKRLLSFHKHAHCPKEAIPAFAFFMQCNCKLQRERESFISLFWYFSEKPEDREVGGNGPIHNRLLLVCLKAILFVQLQIHFGWSRRLKAASRIGNCDIPTTKSFKLASSLFSYLWNFVFHFLLDQPWKYRSKSLCLSIFPSGFGV